MKLSEAIRLGSMMKPQRFGQFYAIGGSCAYGAAFEAVGLDAEEVTLEEFVSTFPISRQLLLTCHLCGSTPEQRDAGGGDKCMVVHLNDDHRWTRESIADWVETVEAQQEAESAPVAEEVGRL